jgi:hypothetical protein
MPYLARASDTSVTVTPPGAGGEVGPSKVLVYSVTGSGSVVAGTTGLTLTIADGAATTLALRYFACPLSTNAQEGFMDLTPGVLFDTSSSATTPGAVVFTVGQTGTAIGSPQIEVVYDFV